MGGNEADCGQERGERLHCVWAGRKKDWGRWVE
jgi:hypothetical protein